ncbi:mucin-4-like isoform X2 [Asterias amurensis]|uniref:mucin-4-like isoform X2 n=1 Tax=Asterias amurensis TaxID=7602 RepID=UPI003AB2EDDC
MFLQMSYAITSTDLLPFGSDNGDSNLQDDCSVDALKNLVSPTFIPPYRFPACGRLQRNIYFTDNGLIVMYNGEKEKYAYPRPTSGTTFGASLNDRVFVAPFYSDVNFSCDSTVYYQVYQRFGADLNQLAVLNRTDEIINDLQVSNFRAEWMLVITWYKVFSSSSSNNLTNTFQATVATNGRQGYTIFQYEVGHMLWDFNVLPFQDVVIGYKCPNGESTYINDPDPKDSIDIHKRPDMYLGNTNQSGIWAYRLDSNSDTYVNPEQECDQWQAVQPDPSTWMPTDDCPCSHNQAMLDSRYELLSLTDLGIDEAVSFSWPLLPKDCYYRTFLASDSPGLLCCYDNLEALMQFPNDVFFGAVSERFSFNPFPTSGSGTLQDRYNTWIEKEVSPRYYCCVASYSQQFCESYEMKRPKKSCSTYMPPTLAWCVGDPHYTTFDNLQYTFNGNGEFRLTLISPRILELAARAERGEVVTNPDALATYFTYFGMRHHQSGKSVGFELDATGTNFIVRIDKTIILTEDQIEQGHLVNECLVKKKKDSQHIIFSCQDGITITVYIEHGMGNLLLSVPDIYKTKADNGLFGTFDGDSQNDLQSKSQFSSGQEGPYGTGPNGTLTASELNRFGYSWRVSTGRLFYYTPPKTYANINTVQTVPTLLNQLESAADIIQLDVFKSGCQNDEICIYDTLVTGNLTLGQTTKQINDGNLQMQEQLDMFPPFLNISYLEVYVGRTFTQQLFAEDRNQDDVTFSLLSVLPNSSLTRGGLFTWTPSSSEKVNITFMADDGTLQSSVTPIVKLCKCLEETQCNYNQFQQDSYVGVDKFAIASCDCPIGRSGATCEEDFNPCVVEPCFPNVLCSDTLAPSLGFTCDTCPTGLMGDGFICQDNESPNVTCPMNIKVLHEMSQGNVSWSPMPKATDVVDGVIDPINITCVNGKGIMVTSGSLFDVGTTTVTCTAVDSSENNATCSFEISVNEEGLSTGVMIILIIVFPVIILLMLCICTCLIVRYQHGKRLRQYSVREETEINLCAHHESPLPLTLSKEKENDPPRSNRQECWK